MIEIRSRHWFVAVLLATTIHLAFALNFERPGEPELAGRGIEIHLGAPSGGNSDATELRPVGAADLDEIAGSTVDLMDTKAVEALDAAELEQEAVESESVKAQPVEEIVAALEPETTLIPAPTLSEVRTTTPPKPTVAARVATKPKSKPAKRIEKKRTTKRKTGRKSQANKASGSESVRTKTSGRGGKGSQGKGGAGGNRGGGGKAASRNYAGTLAAWLNKHKRYPRRARKLGQQGTTKVRFTINRDGRLLSFRILASSGHDLLDQEVREMLRRASPMPAIPKAIARAELTVTVPISFTLR